MVDVSDYYESDPPSGARRDPARYPPSHVRWHPALRVLPGAERIARRLGLDPLALGPSMGRELDRQAPLLAQLGDRASAGSQ